MAPNYGLHIKVRNLNVLEFEKSERNIRFIMTLSIIDSVYNDSDLTLESVPMLDLGHEIPLLKNKKRLSNFTACYRQVPLGFDIHT